MNRAHPVLGGPTIAIGTTIAGGHKVNVVPDLCEATLDVRMVPGMTAAGVLSWACIAAAAGGRANPEVLYGMLGPLGRADVDGVQNVAALRYEHA